MSGPAVRSRLLTLQHRRRAARSGRDLLEKKREVLLRALLRRTLVRNEIHTSARNALAASRAYLRQAQVELGWRGVEAAALAQGVTAEVEWQMTRFVGIPLPRLRAHPALFRPRYAPGGTAESLDDAGRSFLQLLPVLARLAEEDIAVARIHEGLEKTMRRLNALEKVVLPYLDKEIIEVSAALEEEERDEALRVRRAATIRLGAHVS